MNRNYCDRKDVLSHGYFYNPTNAYSPTGLQLHRELPSIRSHLNRISGRSYVT